jgi:hypothetical protein
MDSDAVAGPWRLARQTLRRRYFRDRSKWLKSGGG